MTFKTHGRMIRSTVEKPLPPKPQMAMNATRALGRNVAALLNGQRLFLDKESQEKRFLICRGCELFRPSDERCSHKDCGCRLRQKTFLKAERCPAGKW